jgi:hypothetical protein
MELIIYTISDKYISTAGAGQPANVSHFPYSTLSFVPWSVMQLRTHYIPPVLPHYDQSITIATLITVSTRRLCQNDIILQIQSSAIVETTLTLTLPRLEIHHQVILDREDGVGAQVGVVGGEDLGGDGFEGGVGYLGFK